MRFIHSADWQLGERFVQFGAKAVLLREARQKTLATALRRAGEMEVDAFLIAGDFFGDGQVDDAVIRGALDAFAAVPELCVFILPGNHDPYSGPGCVWERRLFQQKPANVTVLSRPMVCELSSGFLIASPLQQKVSTIDPSVKLAELARDLPIDRIRVGITHGALAIPGKHQPNDFPIALDAASRAGLDYLAVGHWHNGQVYDNRRLVVSGTPEPDDFDQTFSGYVVLAEIAQRGVTPKLTNIPVASLQWRVLEYDLVEFETARQSALAGIEELKAQAASTVLRVALRGSVSPGLLEGFRRELESALQSFAAWLLDDDTRAAFTAAEMAELQGKHPFLGQTIADLAQFEHLVCGSPPPGLSDIIPLAEAQRLLADARIEVTKLDSRFFRLAHQLLSQKLQELSR
jgi:DNA repair exonuclease SbcCD nuclease subunit